MLYPDRSIACCIFVVSGSSDYHCVCVVSESFDYLLCLCCIRIAFLRVMSLTHPDSPIILMSLLYLDRPVTFMSLLYPNIPVTFVSVLYSDRPITLCVFPISGKSDYLCVRCIRVDRLPCVPFFASG